MRVTSRQESVRMHHANLGCNYADSQIISSTVSLSVEKVDFGKYIYAGAECVLTYYPHILAQEGQFRFVYLFRFRKSYLFSANDVMTYDMCRNDYDMGSGRLPAWQGCDVDHPMQHNGVVNPPPNNPPPPTPARNCPRHGHWDDGQGRCVCDGDFAWDGSNCIYQSCPRHGHFDVAQDKCDCNDGYHDDNGQCFKDAPPSRILIDCSSTSSNDTRHSNGPIFVPPRISIDCSTSRWWTTASSKEDCPGEASTNELS
ncbi:hypothetical protein EDD86DRAFT_64617 [Gorgonomyces haynaldii]|nr:hypothetical protein EDD86DRAFT_101897 [Gorgonomyces haynaldii]KAI8905989.1 hypothetical protein EDD86DRAFT_64617 [Gorgonomyces haynaldii]